MNGGRQSWIREIGYWVLEADQGYFSQCSSGIEWDLMRIGT